MEVKQGCWKRFIFCFILFCTIWIKKKLKTKGWLFHNSKKEAWGVTEYTVIYYNDLSWVTNPNYNFGFTLLVIIYLSYKSFLLTLSHLILYWPSRLVEEKKNIHFSVKHHLGETEGLSTSYTRAQNSQLPLPPGSPGFSRGPCSGVCIRGSSCLSLQVLPPMDWGIP